MSSNRDVERRFRAALDAFVEKVKADERVLAAILFGSLAHDDVWEQSDIDVYLVARDENVETKTFCLVEDGIDIHVMMWPRGRFRQLLEGSLRSGFFHTSFARSVLLFSRDETIAEYYADRDRLGARDRDVQLMRAAIWALPNLTKAEKWLVVKQDPRYSFKWLMGAIDGLAEIEVLCHGELTGREVVHRAIELNPDFFDAVYTGLIDGPVTLDAMRRALDRANTYLLERATTLFKPIFDYLAEEGTILSTTELNARFETVAQADGLSIAYEWLARHGFIEKASVPCRLTRKSRVTVEEAAYYYDDWSGFR